MRTLVSLVAAAVVVAVGLALTAVPLPALLGMDPFITQTLIVAVAAGLATFLVWFGLRS